MTVDSVAVSIATSFEYAIPFDAQVPLIAEAGFTHLSLGAREDHSAYLSVEGRRRIGGLLRANGLAIDTIHGPRLDQPDSVAVLAAVTHAAADLAAPVVVVHASPFALPAVEIPTRQAALLRTCAALAPGARQAGIRYALENVLPGPATELVTRVLDDLDPAVFGFCYDSAHDQIGGPRPFTLLRRLGARLIAVQLPDRIRDYVDHVLPGDGFAVRRAAPVRLPWPGAARSSDNPFSREGHAPLLAAGAR